jgi:mannan endo-1,4-beta-mannosidase
MQTSNTTPTSRMATCLVLALATAAITACGGGAADGEATASSATTTAAATSTTTTSTDTTSASTSTDTSTTSATSDSDTAVASASTDVSAQRVAVKVATSTTTATRPSTNTGTGFFVSGSKVYDAKGAEFRVRGVNRVHWDNGSTGLWLSKANTERIAIDFTQSTATNMGVINNQILAHKMVPMPGNWNGTCSSDPAALTAIVDTWVAQASAWTALNSNGAINIANEWGPNASSTNHVWRDSYITAIKRMRAAGYTGLLVIDAAGCGQDAPTVTLDGAAVLAADPQHNVLFDVHVYGNFYYPATASWMIDYTKSLAALAATGLPVMLGEFGPGKNVGPSPTLITPTQVIATAEAAGWGWLAWAWDDNNLASCKADDNWFSMTTSCGSYASSSDLTTFGKTIVTLLQSMATPATIF